jgi:hypothetical protein
MNEPQTRRSQEQIRFLADQHNAMLKYCSQIAELDIPAVVRALERALAAAGDGALVTHREEARQRLKENLTVARLALEIHREVKRQIRCRYNAAWQ